MSYHVIRNNYYYPNTYGAPPDRVIVETCHNRRIAERIAQYLNRANPTDRYDLSHGEYAAPHYEVESAKKEKKA